MAENSTKSRLIFELGLSLVAFGALVALALAVLTVISSGLTKFL